MPAHSNPGPSSPAQGGAPGVYLLIPTHTTRHLACCLAALAHQTLAPRAVVVTCDTDDPSIGALLDAWWPRVAARLGPVPLLHTFRPHQGRAQLNQVRNNGLRALRSATQITPRDLVVVLDGDTMLAPDALAFHAERRAAEAELIIPYRYELEEAPTATVTPDAVLERGIDTAALETPAIRADLLARDRRYRKNLLLSRWGLTKRHKPKLIGGHHAVGFDRLLEINGFDEEYVGYRFNDDDLCRRLRSLRPALRVSIAVADIRAFHLWHTVRAPSKLQDAPGYARWSRTDLPTRCARGIDNPLEQPAPTLRTVPGASGTVVIPAATPARA